jgi:Lambda phage tail tube protein, TTP
MAKMIGKGAALLVGDDTTPPTVYTKVPQCSSIGEIVSESTDVDVSDLDSAEAEYIPGIKEPQETVFQFLWDPQNVVHQQMQTDADAGTVRPWKVEVRNLGALVTTGTFDGYIKRWGAGPMELRTAIMMNFTIKRSGPVTWTPGP